MIKNDFLLPNSLRLSTFNAPRKIMIGLDSINLLGSELSFREGNRILIVTDKGVRNAGIVDRVTDILKGVGLIFEIYDKVEPDPHIETAKYVAEMTRTNNYDAIIGLGGGSPMDTAKVASFAPANPGDIEKYLGKGLIECRGLPLVCVPTTSGTGSETTVSAVFSVGKLKRSFASPHIVPDAAVVDPGLTVSMPPKTTAGSGLDALSHAVEGIISLYSTPLTQSIGLEAINMINNHIRRAYFNGKDLEARYNMSFASMMAGLSFSDPGVVHGHSVAQTLGPFYNVPHGLSCAMTLPFIMEFYRSIVPDKLSMIAKSLGVDTTRLTVDEAAEVGVRVVRELNEDLEIPSLKAVGADRKDFTKIAGDCVKSWVRPNSPMQLTEKKVIKILEKMWSES